MHSLRSAVRETAREGHSQRCSITRCVGRSVVGSYRRLPKEAVARRVVVKATTADATDVLQLVKDALNTGVPEPVSGAGASQTPALGGAESAVPTESGLNLQPNVIDFPVKPATGLSDGVAAAAVDVQPLAEAASPSTEAAKQLVDSAPSAQFAPSAQSSVSSFFQKLQGAAQDAMENIQDTVGDIQGNIQDNISGAVSAVQSNLPAGTSDPSEPASGSTGTASSAASDSISSVIDATKQATDAMPAVPVNSAPVPDVPSAVDSAAAAVDSASSAAAEQLRANALKLYEQATKSSQIAPRQPSAPSFNAPQIGLPKFEAPRFEAPKFEAPKFEIPELRGPGDVVKGAQSAFDSLVSSFEASKSSATQGVTDRVTSVTSDAGDAVNRVISDITGKVDSVTRAAAEGPTQALQAAASAVQQSVQQITSSLPPVPPVSPELQRLGENALSAVGKALQPAADYPLTTLAVIIAAFGVRAAVTAVTSLGYAGVLNAKSAFEMLNSGRDALLIDVRNDDEIARGGLPLLRRRARGKGATVSVPSPSAQLKKQVRNSKQLAYDLTVAQIESLPNVNYRTTFIIMDDRGTSIASEVAKALNREGYINAFTLAGGFKGWVDNELPVRTDSVTYVPKPAEIIQEEAEVLTEKATTVVSRLSDPVIATSLVGGAAGSVYTFYNYHTVLQYVGALSILLTIANKLLQYNSPDEFVDDVTRTVKITTRTVSSTANAVSSGVSTVSTGVSKVASGVASISSSLSSVDLPKNIPGLKIPESAPAPRTPASESSSTSGPEQRTGAGESRGDKGGQSKSSADGGPRTPRSMMDKQPSTGTQTISKPESKPAAPKPSAAKQPPQAAATEPSAKPAPAPSAQQPQSASQGQ